MTNRSKRTIVTARIAPDGGTPWRLARARRRGIAALLATMLALGALGGDASAETDADRRLRALEQTLQRQEQMIKRQEQEIKELHTELRQQRAVSQATENRAEEAAQNAQNVKQGLDQAKSKLVPDWVNKVGLFGDVRYRHEGFYHQPKVDGQDVTARNRERVRARIGLKYTYSDELSATFRGATGNINDPVSTNETLTGNWNRKNFNLDWAYITFSPGKSFDIRPGLVTSNFGKFPNPLFKTDELVFDEDVSAEGLSQTFQLLDAPRGDLDQVRIHALEWVLNEVANKEDGWMFGGQINPIFHFGPVQFEAGLGQYWWLNSDLIAQAISRNTTGFTTAGAPVANSNFNSVLAASNQNLLDTVTIQPPVYKGRTKPAAFQSIVGYQSGFNQTNLTLAGTLPNVLFNQPLKVWLDYVYNWEAATSDSYGVQGGLRLGAPKVKGDWSVWAFYEYLGQEAVISAFTSSEFGPNGGSNQQGPAVGIDYQLLNPLTVSAKGYFSNYINRPANTTNPTLSRIQLDAVVKW